MCCVRVRVCFEYVCGVFCVWYGVVRRVCGVCGVVCVFGCALCVVCVWSVVV